MSNPYRDCLAKLANKIDFTWGDIPADVEDLLCRARTLLDQPELPELTDEEIEEWADACSEAPLQEMDPEIHSWRRCFTAEEFSETIRAALIHWGHPTPQPEPPTPISAHDLAIQWNRQADQSEQWDSLELYEQLAFAQARAIAADRARRIP
jgi:hypothetical protein